MDSRIAERRAEVRHERMVRRRHRALVLVLAGLVLAAGLALERSSLVALAAVEVNGVERVGEEAVREAAALQIGTSTLRLRLGPAAARVEALPEVLRVEARRVDPLTVRIDVVERRPSLVVVGGGGAVLADVDGVVLGRGPAGALPTITVGVPVPAPGATLDDTAETRAAFRVYRGLPGPLRAEVVSYAVDETEVALVLASGAQVRFGRADRIAEKARVLGALLEDLEPDDGWRIDVRAPGAPVVTPPEVVSHAVEPPGEGDR